MVWFGSNCDSVHSSGASVQVGPTQNLKLVRFIACVGYARVDITMLMSLDDVAVATDWTPRTDMVELRGDTWHEASANRVHACREYAGICSRVERRLQNLLARGGAWRRVCRRTNSFSAATDRSADDDANGGALFSVSELESLRSGVRM